MVAAWVFAGTSYRNAFIFTAIFLIASMSLVLVIMLANPGIWPSWGIAGIAALLALTLGFAGWVWAHPEPAGKTPED